MTNTAEIQYVSINNLLLDDRNPRFGGNIESSITQKSLLESIVEKHGVTDLLTSMSANGYFSAEPVVAVPDGAESYIVVEGNRRLAAALILTQSDRASDYKDLATKWVFDTNRDKVESLKEFPVSVLPERNEELIAYLGAKHIRGSKPWDSYAKAHWLFELMASSGSAMTVEQAARLVGDQNPNTVKRILEAYVLMQQLREERNYRSEHSMVSGRGSNPDYPFSWVYTALGYENIRTWIDIAGLDSRQDVKADTKVLKTEKALSNSEKLIDFLFGSKSKPSQPVVKESRGIRLLSELVKDSLSVQELENGSPVEDVWESLRPVEERLEDLFFKSMKDLETINTLIAREELGREELEEFRKVAKKSLNLLNTIVETLGSRL